MSKVTCNFYISRLLNNLFIICVTGAESEEISDGDDEDDDASSSKKKKTDKKKSGKKRKAPGKPRKANNGTFKRRRFQRNNAAQDSDDDEEDVDFTGTESHGKRTTSEDGEDKPNSEQVAAEEAAEKAETDLLWASFLTSVNDEKEKRKKGLERTVEKVVNKVVDFAGEKISVQEKVKVTLTSNSNGGGGQDSPSSSVSTVALSDVSTSNASTSTATTRVDDEPVPGPSSAMRKMNGQVQQEGKTTSGPKARRGGISILGNDPETIGLDELDKRGLSGLLKAVQNKAAAAKRIGTLEKSKLDWEQYKRNQGLEEELTHHNKSKDT